VNAIRAGVLVWAVTAASVAAFAACKPDAHDGKAAPSASASAATVASASARPAGPTHFTGTYTSKASELFVPDAEAYKGFKFRGDDAGSALGDGPIKLTVALDGKVTGSLEGPLGPATLDGVATDAGITFRVTADDPKADLALSGTGEGEASPSEVKGTMQLSSWHANLLRQATFTAKAQP
jgi:hypothetical protein